jgi:hypothetical protein
MGAVRVRLRRARGIAMAAALAVLSKLKER